MLQTSLNLSGFSFDFSLAHLGCISNLKKTDCKYWLCIHLDIWLFWISNTIIICSLRTQCCIEIHSAVSELTNTNLPVLILLRGFRVIIMPLSIGCTLLSYNKKCICFYNHKHVKSVTVRNQKSLMMCPMLHAPGKSNITFYLSGKMYHVN